ncbi:hypothetical protein EMIHUDRAFT_201744 [Emiliania huxleyi CCMP1516]|uniref:Ion transport domain-containing protein n=2 Tax=Emiliania huxleyi TaxID=2903 RepID=A0A0D3KII7_EMIH1|nr:hypothetical protein EMIHUDRAFT_201744 [Emiliania huxleyi CCMP1516]EOD35572.1 hypothetical protein EMIHUDRAFT_201744 [Emiliania huxleyi CCMP1516]|eukprot:XP_005788001.1 hypothetical protein EMIHUDRAFT_201744 [Emiliania huxleyi CCMP1516]
MADAAPLLAPRLGAATRDSRRRQVLSIVRPKRGGKRAAATAYAWLLAGATLLCVVQLVVASYPELGDDPANDVYFFVADAVLSSIFLADYSLRLYSAPELPRMVTRGLAPGEARLRWVLSGEAVVYALSTFPFFLDLLVDGRYSGVFDSGLNASWVRVFRILNIFRTSEYSAAVNTVLRVLVVNRTILLASLAMVLFMVLLTATLLYSILPDATLAANGIRSIPDAAYLAVLMLTGQALPEGSLSSGTRLIVLFTSFFSVPIFAVPAAMLTWGFEESAAGTIAAESSDDSDSDFEEYLRTAAGAEGDDGEFAEEALSFFERASSDAVGGGGRLLPEARRLAQEIESKQQRAARTRHLRCDALHLVEASYGEDKPDGHAEALMEARLQSFAQLVHSSRQAEASTPLAAPLVSGSGADVEEEVASGALVGDAQLRRLEAVLDRRLATMDARLAKLEAALVHRLSSRSASRKSLVYAGSLGYGTGPSFG